MKVTKTEITSAFGKVSGLPAWVGGWEIETGIGVADERTAWVWALLEDEAADFAAPSRLRDKIRDCGRQVRQKAGTEGWVYVQSRGASEMAHTV